MPGTRIHAALKEEGRQLQWLAARLGVSRQVLHRWAVGGAPCPPNRRAQIAEILNREESDLFETTRERK